MKKLLLLVPALLLAGCDPISLTALGIGAGAGVSHEMSGYTYRTFTEPLPRVRKAAIMALNRMAIKVQSTEKTDSGEVINAKGADRSIELELEAISGNTTRLRSVARKNTLFMDSATATEIIVQTERVLAGA
jgi:hypothetical protein